MSDWIQEAERQPEPGHRLTIQVRTRHVTEDEAHVDVSNSHDRCLIDPATAVTIASWYASSGYEGKHLAMFATGYVVDRFDLLADIVSARWGLPHTLGYERAGQRLQQERALIGLIDFVILHS